MENRGTIEEIHNCVMCNRKSACFKTLTDDELDLFDKSRSSVNYRKGETIIKQGTEFTHVISFNEGLAKLNVEIGPSKNLLLGIIKPSEIIGGPGMFADNRYAFSISALTESSICLISAEMFKKIYRSNEEFAEKFMTTFSKRYIDAIKRLVSITQKQMHGRVAEALLFFSNSIYNSDSFYLDLSRQELADFTGMSKESISRIFKDLNEENIISSNGRQIDLLNREKLHLLNETS
jgi:CRP/FNR family transcriptional regulator, polysaccharide utilization system transcription regulator